MHHSHQISFSIKTFRHAIQGLKTAFQEQFNFKIHFTFAFFALLNSWFFALSTPKLLFILLAIFLVFIAELFNSSIEYLSDALTQDFHPLIKKAKDVAAGAVLLAAIFAIIVGLVIFIPYYQTLL